MASLFLDEDYKELTYSFLPGMEQTVLALTSAGTDFDLTGQIVWPVSVFLAWFVATNEPLFRAKTIVELGAGTGLGGFVSARVSAHTVLTDGNDVVLKMLRDGVARGHVARHVAASAREGAGGVGGVGGDGGGGGGDGSGIGGNESGVGDDGVGSGVRHQAVCSGSGRSAALQQGSSLLWQLQVRPGLLGKGVWVETVAARRKEAVQTDQPAPFYHRWNAAVILRNGVASAASSAACTALCASTTAAV